MSELVRTSGEARDCLLTEATIDGGDGMYDGELSLYEAEDRAHVQLRASQGTISLFQAEIAELYGSSPQSVQQTIVRVLGDGEVDESTINFELMVRTDGTRHVRREVRNKMRWDGTGDTAAEIVKLRSDPTVATMGLTSWSGSVVRKGDVVTAKNYLASDDIGELDRIVTMHLDYAEDQAKRRQRMTMADWAQPFNASLTLLTASCLPMREPCRRSL